MGDKIHSSRSVQKHSIKFIKLQQSEFIKSSVYLTKLQCCVFCIKSPYCLSLGNVSVLSYSGGMQTKRGNLALKILYFARYPLDLTNSDY